MVWSNYFLIPIVLIGGLLAYMFGQTVIGGVLRRVGGLFAPRAAAPTPTPEKQFYVDLPPRLDQPIYTPPAKSSPRRLLAAERMEELEDKALQHVNAEDALADEFRAFQLEQTRKKAAAKRILDSSKSTNVLKGKVEIDLTAGPATQFTQLSDAMQEVLKNAALQRDAADPK